MKRNLLIAEDESLDSDDSRGFILPTQTNKRTRINDRAATSDPRVSDDSDGSSDLEDAKKTVQGLDGADMNKYLKARVAKLFQGKLFFGTVKGYWNWNDENKGEPQLKSPWFFSVIFDDDDVEDFSLLELENAIRLFRQATHHTESSALTSRFDAPAVEDSSAFVLATPDEVEVDENLINMRVSKMFGERAYFGDIVDETKEGYYLVCFDDGDFEDWDLSEAKLGIRLCRQVIPQIDYSLWNIYDIDPRLISEQWDLAKRAGVNYWPKAFVKNADTVIKFYLFLMERQRSWVRRKAHKKKHDDMWSSDGVIRKYYFCNIYRELDRGTAFLRSQILTLWDKFNKFCSSREDWLVEVLWASYCYRLANKVESFQPNPDAAKPSPTSTFGRIPKIHEWPEFKRLVKRSQSEDSNFFTGAHQTCGYDRYIQNLTTVYNHQEKLHNVARNSDSLEACQQAIISSLPGCGDFMSWQILCDLCEANCLEDIDQDDYCVFGKGAKAGILEIFYHGEKASLQREQYLEYGKLLVEHHSDFYSRLKPVGFRLEFPYWQNRKLGIKEMEHALCEFSKYVRIERSVESGAKHVGQRIRRSRTHLDSKAVTNACGKCKAPSCIDYVLCDTCNLGYCQRCDPSDRDEISWVCQRCRDLTDHSWSGLGDFDC